MIYKYLSRTLTLLFLFFTASYAANPSVGDKAEIRVWYSSSSSTGGNGIKGIMFLEKIESAFSDKISFTFSLSDNENGNSSLFTMPEEGIKISVNLSNRRPVKIISCSGKFSNVPWVTGMTTNFGFSGSQELYCPVLPPDERYENKDWFNVRFNDTVGIYCEYIESKSAFWGTLKKYRDRQDLTGDAAVKGDKYIMYTRNIPFRLSAIVIHSDIIHCFQKEFEGFGEGYYGLTIGIYSPAGAQRRNQGTYNRKTQPKSIRGYDGRGRMLN